MIPQFDENGYLPPGISATLDEVDERFGRGSEIRQVQMQSIRWLVDLLRHDDIRRLVINGSFVTAAVEPNDVDCVVLPGPRFPRDYAVENELAAGLPFLDIEIVNQDDFNWLVGTMLATDRSTMRKGMIEVLL